MGLFKKTFSFFLNSNLFLMPVEVSKDQMLKTTLLMMQIKDRKISKKVEV